MGRNAGIPLKGSPWLFEPPRTWLTNRTGPCYTTNMVKNPQVIAGLRDELAVLKAELSANPTFQRIQRIEEFLRFYEGDQSKEHAIPTFPLPIKTAPTQKERIVQAVKEIIKGSGGVAKRSVILEQLVAAELIKTKKPIKTLAPILSETSELESDGKGSWRIAKLPFEQQKEGAAM